MVRHDVREKPTDLRAACRTGDYDGPTSGHAQGYVQANMVILPPPMRRNSGSSAKTTRSRARCWKFSIPAIPSRKTVRLVPISAPISRVIVFFATANR